MPAYALIAEFDQQRAALYRQIVEDLGFEAVVVRDGTAAKASLQRREAPSLLLTDLSLPGTDGFSLIADLRQRFTSAKTAVVVFSAFPELRASAADLLASLDIAEVRDKTSSASEIRSAIERALARTSSGPALSHADASTPEHRSNEFLRDVARKFHVPIVLLAVELRQYHWFTAHVGIGEALVGGPEKPQWWNALQQVANTRQPLVVSDAAAVFGAPTLALPLAIRGMVAVPFTTSKGRVIGVLSLLGPEPSSLGVEEIDGLINMARPMADEFERRYVVDLGTDPLIGAIRTEERWAALERLALTDALTGLYNRHAGEQAINREAARSRRSNSSLSLALFDLDGFKQVNDRYGHDAGDLVLTEVGRILKTSFRASDLAIRWGGDEFLVLLPDVALPGAAAFAERTRMQVEALAFAGVGRVTLSAGIVEVGRKEDPVAALRRADASLYEAKASGRNRVAIASETTDFQMRNG